MVLSKFVGISSLEQGIQWWKKDFSENLVMQEWPYWVHYPVFGVNKGDYKYRANANIIFLQIVLQILGKNFPREALSVYAFKDFFPPWTCSVTVWTCSTFERLHFFHSLASVWNTSLFCICTCWYQCASFWYWRRHSLSGPSRFCCCLPQLIALVQKTTYVNFGCLSCFSVPLYSSTSMWGN